MIFPKKPWDWESCSEAVRKVKKLAESWAWTSLCSWRAVADLFIMFNDIARLKKLQKFINFCLKVGHSANLKHSKSTIRQLILLWKLQKHNPAQHFFIGRSSRGRLGTIDLRQLSFWYRVLSCEPTNYESVHTWVIHLLDCEQSLFGQSSLSSAGLERANCARFPSSLALPRSRDHPKGLLAVYTFAYRSAHNNQ